MMKKGVIILFIMMGFFLVAKAQEDGKMVLTGTVVDSQTNEPVAFANLGLLGTVAGVASDMHSCGTCLGSGVCFCGIQGIRVARQTGHGDKIASCQLWHWRGGCVWAIAGL